MDKKIIITISIIFALIFVGLLGTIFAVINYNSIKVASDIDSRTSNLGDMSLKGFDNTIVSGSEVKWALNNLDSYNGYKLGMRVKVTGIGEYMVYGWNTITSEGKVNTGGSISKADTYREEDAGVYKIYDNGTFSSKLIKADNGIVVGIDFSEQ
jgi:hypothetical protein